MRTIIKNDLQYCTNYSILFDDILVSIYHFGSVGENNIDLHISNIEFLEITYYVDVFGNYYFTEDFYYPQ